VPGERAPRFSPEAPEPSKGKLSNLVRCVDGVEVRGQRTKTRLRLWYPIARSAPSIAPVATPDVVALDDEIPF